MSALFWKLHKAMSKNYKGGARMSVVTGFARTPGVERRYGKIYLHTFPKGKVGYGYWCRRKRNVSK